MQESVDGVLRKVQVSIPLPSRYRLADAVLKVLEEAMHPLKSSEIDQSVIKLLKLSEEQCRVIHSGTRTKVAYDLAWTRTSLRVKGHIQQPKKGVWCLNSEKF